MPLRLLIITSLRVIGGKAHATLAAKFHCICLLMRFPRLSYCLCRLLLIGHEIIRHNIDDICSRRFKRTAVWPMLDRGLMTEMVLRVKHIKFVLLRVPTSCSVLSRMQEFLFNYLTLLYLVCSL